MKYLGFARLKLAARPWVVLKTHNTSPRRFGTASSTPPPLLGLRSTDSNPFHRPDIPNSRSEKRAVFPSVFLHAIRDNLPTECRQTALDCACGEGIFTTLLALDEPHGLGFSNVIGVDRNPDYLARATSHPSISYLEADVLNLPVSENSVDLVTIVQALHWLPQKDFLDESVRVLREGGVFAAMGYGVPLLADVEAQGHFHEYYFRELGSHLPTSAPGNMWQCDRRQVDSAHESQSFDPLENVIKIHYEQDHIVPTSSFIDFLRTSSAYHNLVESTTGEIDPLQVLEENIVYSLARAKQATDILHIKLPFWMILGRKYM